MDEEKKKLNVLEKCTNKRLKNDKFSDYIKKFVSKEGLSYIKDCGTFLMLLASLNLEDKKLHKANFCKNRFCPMCAWRLACKDSLEISIIMEHLKKEENKDFIFLTLTMPNVNGDELDDTIKHYNKSFQRLMQLKEVKAIVKGYARKLEITYQKEKYITKELWKRKKAYYENKGLKVGDLEPNYNTFHPHFHIVIAVNKSYFKDTKAYINREKWLTLWQKSTRDTSITQVDVKKFKDNGEYNGVYEIAKYTAKDTDYLINRDVFKTFYNALKGKQLIVYSGLFKDAHKMYQNKELDCYKKQDNIEYAYMINYEWCKNHYMENKLRELTDEEKQQFNGSLVDEIEIE